MFKEEMTHYSTDTEVHAYFKVEIVKYKSIYQDKKWWQFVSLLHGMVKACQLLYSILWDSVGCEIMAD